jgi:putative flippase GtrA
VSAAIDFARNQAVRWLKFNAVGGIGIIVQLSVLAVLASGLHLNYLIAVALSVEAAILHNFLWHERLTWGDRTRVAAEHRLRRLLRFNLTTGLFSIAGNLLLMRVFAGMLGINYVLANLLTIAACSLANYVVSDRVVFRSIGCGADIPVRVFPR